MDVFRIFIRRFQKNVLQFENQSLESGDISLIEDMITRLSDVFLLFHWKICSLFSTTANFPTRNLALKIEVVDLSNQFWLISMFKHKFISKTIAFWKLDWTYLTSQLLHQICCRIPWFRRNDCHQGKNQHWKKIHILNFFLARRFFQKDNQFWFFFL